ncbi:hypothetical protein F5051DRAFT_340711, partial [Lentinula edodes]
AVAQKALTYAERLQHVVESAQNNVLKLSGDSSPLDIHPVLGAAERSLAYLRLELPKIKHAAAGEKVAQVLRGVETLDRRISKWREAYPDKLSPIIIDNRNAFANPGDRLNTPTLIAYTIALVNRLFEGAARRGSSVLLKLLKIYGHSLLSLGGNPTILQRKALNDIPESITTVEKALNLDIPSIPHAVCPKCSFTHPPIYLKGSLTPSYPAFCFERQTELSDPCGTELLHAGKPIKTYHAYSFYDWFGRFIAHPEIEQYGDQFCDKVTLAQGIPETKRNTEDGSFFHTFEGNDGKPFIAGRGEEGRWLFLLHADFFNVEGNRIRGKTNSTGITSLACLNLPPTMRNDSAWIFVPGLIEGKTEPDAKNSEHRHYWRLLITELSEGYSRGLQPRHTYRTHHIDQGLNQRVFRVAIAAVLMDFKAARPFAGFLDVTSHHTCFLCQCWHRAHLGRTDYETWKAANGEFLKKASESWINAKTLKEREAIASFYGTRYSELWRLPYWDPTKQLLVDPMHTIFLIFMQRFFREVLGLDNPESPEKDEKNKSTKKAKKERAFIAFYHDFTPPPHSSEIKPLATTTNSSSNLNSHNAHDIGHMHRYLTQPLLDGATQNLRATLNRMTVIALVFVCADLGRLPAGKFVKAQLVEELIQWRLTKPMQPLQRVDIESHYVLQRIQQSIQDIIVPSWITRPPSEVGLQRAGTLKADHWRVLFAIHLPLTLISLWSRDSPVAAHNAGDMTAVLETSMHLTCASILMTRNSLSPERRHLFRTLLRKHLQGLKQIFPGFVIPSHHLAFHIYDFMESFSTVRNWWGFPFETLIGRLQRIPTNHKIGQLEWTLLQSFYRGAAFRRWLTRPDCPELLKFCRDLLNKAYGYDKCDETLQQTAVEDTPQVTAEFVQQANDSQHSGSDSGFKLLKSAQLPRKLAREVGTSHPKSYSQIPGVKGFYGIPSLVAVGNSYVCYHLNQDSRTRGEWVAGQIQHIFEHEEKIKLAIARSKPLVGRSDPFIQFGAQGFDARTVSSHFYDNCDIVPVDLIMGHAARWELQPGFIVILSLNRVSYVAHLHLPIH